MPNRSLTIQGTEVGLDVNKVAIYKSSISASNLVAVVPKSVFMSGYSFSDDDQQEDYVCQCDDPCRTVLNLSLRAANQPPTVTITGATSSLTNANVTLTANANDPEGFPMTYLWSTGETTQSITVTSATAQTATYTVTVTDDIGDTGSDTHDIVWTVPTTTTTAAPGTTTTSTAAPCTDCAGDINSISDFSAAVGGTTGTISITGTNISPSSVYTWDPNLVTVSLSGSTLTWTTNNTDTCGTAHVRVFANNTAGGNCCTEAEDFYITVTGCVGPTTTTTTTAAPATTTTTTAAPATTTTTTTQAPGYWNLRICSNGTLANQQVQDTGNINTGDVFLAGNGICYEVDTFQSNQSGGLQIIVSEFGDCQECLDGNGAP